MSEYWTVTHDPPTFCYSVCNVQEHIADIFYAQGIPEDQEAQRLKAHTIAAAPALLEALAAIDCYFCGRLIREPAGTPCPRCEDARAALRLARGGQA